MIIVTLCRNASLFSGPRCAKRPTSLNCAFDLSDFAQKTSLEKKCVMCKVPASLGQRFGLHLSQIVGL